MQVITRTNGKTFTQNWTASQVAQAAQDYVELEMTTDTIEFAAPSLLGSAVFRFIAFGEVIECPAEKAARLEAETAKLRARNTRRAARASF